MKDESGAHVSTMYSVISRRRIMEVSAGAVGALGAASLDLGYPLLARGGVATLLTTGDQRLPAQSVAHGYAFLNQMMDAYRSGTTLRLAQSYSDQAKLKSTAFIYDNALQILAYLARGTADDTARAAVLGDSLLFAQAHDPFGATDNRLRQGYYVAPSLEQRGVAQGVGNPVWLAGTSVGDMAWVGLGLARLYAVTHASRYLQGACAIGTWIANRTYAVNGSGGYTGGLQADGSTPNTWKSTEHNIDACAFFTQLAQLTNNDKVPAGSMIQTWSSLAAHAQGFIMSMWNSAGKHFYTGTKADGVATNTTPIPEDANTWSYLALRKQSYAASIDWVRANLMVTDNAQRKNTSLRGRQSFTGVTFSDASTRVDESTLPLTHSHDPKPDDHAVWFEGSAHLAAALQSRARPANPVRGVVSDHDTAMMLLQNLAAAQAQLGVGQTVGGTAIASGMGLVAASSALDSGYGYDYFGVLHVGATAWYLVAAAGANPLRL